MVVQLPFPLVRLGLAFVGEPLALVRNHLALVANALTLAGEAVALSGRGFEATQMLFPALSNFCVQSTLLFSRTALGLCSFIPQGPSAWAHGC